MSHKIHQVALFRLSVLGPLASRDTLAWGELHAVALELARQTYNIPGSLHTTISAKTIERWYYRWCKHGIDGLEPVTRSDKGHSELSPEIQQAILECKKANPARSINTIRRCLQNDGVIAAKALSRSSVHRLLTRHGLSQRTVSGVSNIERRSFESQYAGDLWFGDVMHAPAIQTSHGMRKVYLATLFDDASRLVCHSAFYLDEGAVSIECALKEALLKRGIPKRLMVDNGAAYKSKTFQDVCARLKIQLIYSRPYEPESKGKLERWHKSVREQCLTEIDFKAIQSLDELNARFWVWLERMYHQTPHSALPDNQTPLMRYQRDLLKIQPLGAIAQHLDDYFYHRHPRKVKKDGTVSFEKKSYEVGFKHVGKKIYLVVDPSANYAAKWIESLDGEHLGPVHPLDKLANLNRARKRPGTVNNTQQASTAKPLLVDSIYEKEKNRLNLTNKK